MLNLVLMRTVAVYVARAAASATIGVVVVSALTKASTAAAHELKMYKAYREAYKQAEAEYEHKEAE